MCPPTASEACLGTGVLWDGLRICWPGRGVKN